MSNAMAGAQRASGDELTVDELARQTKLPVRTIREYQTLRLLPPPRRRGRIGLYGPEHTQRLGLIGRLQQRGYSLAGIKDLLEAWDAGTNLTALLGVADVSPAAIDETPLRLTRQQLVARLPGLTAASQLRARAVGLVQPDGPDHVIVRSPALLALAADGVAAGVPLADVLDLIDALGDELSGLADTVAELLIERIWEPFARQGRAAEIEPLLRRGPLLLLQGAVSTLADRLGAAILQRAEGAADGDALRAAIERIRVGAVTDTDGISNSGA